MNQTDENEFYEGDLEAEFIAETVEENDSNQLTLAKRKQKQKQVVVVHQSIDAAKSGFLKLLIRCRRIILQDAEKKTPLPTHIPHQTTNLYRLNSSCF